MSRRLVILVVAIAVTVEAVDFVVSGILVAAGAPWPAWLIVSVAGAFVAAFAAWLVFRHVAVALDTVQAASERLSEGEFTERVPELPGAAGELGYHFNSMAARMENLFDGIAAEHARLEAVFDAARDGMVAVSADTTVRFMNPAAVQLFGVPMIDAIGRSLIETARDYELDAIVRKAAAGAEQGPSVIAFGPDRTSLRVSAAPIRDGGDWSVLLTLTDLTEVRRLDQVRRDFIGNVSHELRTPLASIRAMVETLEDSDLDDHDTAAEFMRRIRQQVDRLSMLVHELLDLSRIESGAAELNPEPVSLREVASEAASLLRMRSELTHITIDLPPETDDASIEADRSSVLRITSNLLDNAMKYGREGTAITVRIHDEGPVVALSVHDDGPGIEEQALPRVFERFYKGDTSRTGEGVGLGLAIVKHLARAHGGTAEVQSKPGEGATFTVRLPKRFTGRRTTEP
ncbi:PAS domain-containing protein [bacterium]|nr:PAS domain-containing protein [bacterium]